MKNKISVIWITFFFCNYFSFAKASCIKESNYSNSIEKYSKSKIWKNDLGKAIYWLDSLELVAKTARCNEFITTVIAARANAYSYNGEDELMLKELKTFDRFYKSNKAELQETKVPFFLNYTWGRYYSIGGEFKLAEPHFKEAFSILENLERKGEIDIQEIESYKSITLRQIGHALSNMGRYEDAKHYQEMALALIKDNPIRELLNLKHIAKANQKLKKYDEAEKYYSKAVALIKKYLRSNPGKFEQEKNNFITVYNNFAGLHIDKGTDTNDPRLFRKAKSYLRESLKFHKSEKEETELQFTYRLFGDLETKLGNFKQAEKYYLLAQEAAQTDWEKSKSTIQLSKVFLQKKDFNRALKTVQNSIDFLEREHGNFLNDPIYVDALTTKANIYYDKYQSGKKQNDLVQSWETVLQCSQRIGEMALVFDSFEDKENLIVNSNVFFETGIEIGYALLQSSKDGTYANQIFELVEQSKSVVLRDVLAKTYALKVGIPQNLQRKNNYKRAAILKQKRKLKKYNSNHSKYSKTLEKYLALNESYAKFSKDTLSQYSEYLDLMNESNIVSLASLQATLGSSQSLLEYFIGGTNSFALVIKGYGDVEVIKLRLTDSELEKNVRNFSECLKTHNNNSCLINWPKESNNLYKLVFQPVEKLVTERVTIIPDGALCYIPFSTLVYSYQGRNEKNKIPYASLNYLLEKYTFNYNYSSSTLIDNDVQQEEVETSFYGFAPSFNSQVASTELGANDKYNLPDIPNSPKLIAYLGDYFSISKLFKKERATKAAFLQNAPKADVIHLHTHGVFDEDAPDNSFLAFCDKNGSIRNSKLYISELYGMNLKADIVTLPACFSGYGRTLKGQGIISLARGFFHAGAKNVFPSLWQSNNASISEITRLFYENLSNGLDEPEAMTQAKRTYLKGKKGMIEAYPYFWGSYISIGKISSESQSIFSFKWLLFALGIALVAYLFLSRKSI